MNKTLRPFEGHDKMHPFITGGIDEKPFFYVIKVRLPTYVNVGLTYVNIALTYIHIYIYIYNYVVAVGVGVGYVG